MIVDDKPSIAEMMASAFGDMTDEEYLLHYGMPKRSGRYPYGSGENPYQHSGDFLSRVETLKKEGKKESEIAEALGITNHKGDPDVSRLRAQISNAKDDRRLLDVATAEGLRKKGYSLNEIAKQMGFKNDSSVRSLLNEDSKVRSEQAKATADLLREQLKEKGMIDVGDYVHVELGISKEKLNQAVEILRMEGWPVYGGRIPQINNPSNQTTFKVLASPDFDYKDAYNYDNIKTIKEYASTDGGESFHKFQYPKSMDSKRLQICYKEDGGIEKDGIVELRRGVEDLSLGDSRYSQVRILVDNKKYIKGMAVYADDLPDGIDVRFNTNKSKDVPKLEVLKDIKNDPDNPFGSYIGPKGQSEYTDKNGKKQLSLINKRADQGDWSEWKDKLPSQFLSKQTLSLAKRQLGIAVKDKQSEFDDIMSLTNPTVKKKLLESFANDCDSAAVHLHAAALPRQKYHVIIPVNSLKDNEIYAPNYKDGEQVALVRYPHGGTFEIPICTVNNKNRTAKKLLGSDIEDAVGINSKVAERLSGADFDGDTVMVIPTNNKVKIKSTPQLDGLDGFDPKMSYGSTKKKTGKYDDKGNEIIEYYNDKGTKFKPMANTQNEMGRISNLITDMTLKGATKDELAAAVRHSMVVIDAEKHKLDYKSSYVDNNIEGLKKKYQEGGASTLLSRAKGEKTVTKRQGTPKINLKGKSWYDPSKPEGSLIYKDQDDPYYPDQKWDKKSNTYTLSTTTRGKKVVYDPSDTKAADYYKPVRKVDPKTGEVSFTNKDGTIQYKVKTRTQATTNMADTDDARSLISKADTQMERYYADYANKMKSLANQARKELVTTPGITYSKTAASTYKAEVDSLKSKLNESLKNKPRERQAQARANAIMKAKEQENPDMTKEEKKKYGQMALEKARAEVGAVRTPIKITDKEWEAIQSGAIHDSTLKDILRYTDLDTVREKATPRNTKTLSQAKINRANRMRDQGYTLAQIADQLGVSASTVSNYLH